MDRNKLKILLKNDVITFLGSDVHHESNEYHLPEAEKRVLKIVRSEEKLEALFEKNAEKILNDEEIEKE